jgi:hypothetical protein
MNLMELEYGNITNFMLKESEDQILKYQASQTKLLENSNTTYLSIFAKATGMEDINQQV